MNQEVSRREFLGASLGGVTVLAGALGPAEATAASAHENPPYGVHVRLARYDGNQLIDQATTPLMGKRSGPLALKFAGSEWVCDCTVAMVPDRPDAIDFVLNFKVVQGSPKNQSVGVLLTVDHWSTDNYVLIPAALYNGNRFESRHLDYPPLLTDPKDIGPNVPTIITDVPRLNISEGPSTVQLITGDMSTPAIGFYAPDTKQGFWLLTDQNTRLGDNGLGIEENHNRDRAYITLTAPHVRERYKYRICTTKQPSDARGADFQPGDEVRLRCRLYCERYAKRILRRDRLKILHWDRDGFVLWYKRLEEGVFKLPRGESGARSQELRASELAMILEGIDVSRLQRLPRYERGAR